MEECLSNALQSKTKRGSQIHIQDYTQQPQLSLRFGDGYQRQAGESSRGQGDGLRVTEIFIATDEI